MITISEQIKKSYTWRSIYAIIISLVFIGVAGFLAKDTALVTKYTISETASYEEIYQMSNDLSYLDKVIKVPLDPARLIDLNVVLEDDKGKVLGVLYGMYLPERDDFSMLYLPLSIGSEVTEVTAKFTSVPSSLKSVVEKELQKVVPDYDYTFQYLMLEALEPGVLDYVYYAVIALLLLFAGYKTVRILTVSPERLLRKATAKTQDPEHAMYEMQNTMYDPNEFALQFTQKYLFLPQSLEVVEKQDVLWAYRVETKQKAYGVVTVSTHHSLSIHTEHATYSNIVVKQSELESVLEKILLQCPNAVVGFHKEMNKLFHKDVAEFKRRYMTKTSDDSLTEYAREEAGEEPDESAL